MFLVSHDRRFVDNVVTSTIAWEGDAAYGGRPACGASTKAASRTGRRSATRRARAAPPPPAAARRRAASAAPPRRRPRRTTKLSYKEQRELDALPARIEALEAEQKPIAELLADPPLYARDPQRAAALHARHARSTTS